MTKKEDLINKERIEEWAKADLVIENFAKDSNSKYGNKKIRVNGVLYDSHKEYYRHLELNILEKHGIIKDVKFHSKDDVLLVVSNPDVKYIPDFTYIDEEGNKVVEDVKGMQTPDFIIKKKIVISRVRSGEYDFTYALTRKYKNGFQAFEKYSKSQTYIKPKLKRKKKIN